MSDTDPLLRAIAKGDPAAPDGRALVALGRLARTTALPPHPVDLVSRVVHDIQMGEGGADIDAWVERGACDDAQLTQLLTLTRRVATPPRQADLTGRVRLRLGAGRLSTRLFTVLDDRSGIVRKRARIIAAVIAGHLAAAMIFALVRVNLDQDAGHMGGNATSASIMMDGDTGRAAPARPQTSSLLPPRLPAAWTSIRDVEADLFLLRRLPELRDEARRTAGLDGSVALVNEGLDWLSSRQDATTGSIGRVVGNRDQDLATQSLAALALLGEGPGNRERAAVTRRVLGWIITELGHGPARPGHWSLSLASLALVEGALLLGDPPIRQAAERTLARIAGDRVRPDEKGWSGFALLAIETAQQGGLDVPGPLLQQERFHLLGGDDIDHPTADGHAGVSAFAHFIFGHRSASGTSVWTRRLTERTPDAPADGKLDLVGGLFTALALREAGGPAWTAWGTTMGEILSSQFVGEPGLRHLPATRVDDHGMAGDGVVFATALAVLNLQTPYRYLPVE